MKQGMGELTELYLENGLTGGRLLCPQNLIPEPGQYLLAHDPASPAHHGPGRADSSLPAPIFSAGSIPGGFLVAPPTPQKWQAGTTLSLRGPLGRGFYLPASARRVALIAFAESTARLKPLLAIALKQAASVVLVSDLASIEYPPEVEIRPASELSDILEWADYLAIDLSRDSLPELQEKLRNGVQAKINSDAQILVLTPMPCGGLAECGVCAVTVRRGWKMACKDGPVFNLSELRMGD